MNTSQLIVRVGREIHAYNLFINGKINYCTHDDIRYYLPQVNWQVVSFKLWCTCVVAHSLLSLSLSFLSLSLSTFFRLHYCHSHYYEYRSLYPRDVKRRSHQSSGGVQCHSSTANYAGYGHTSGIASTVLFTICNTFCCVHHYNYVSLIHHMYTTGTYRSS